MRKYPTGVQNSILWVQNERFWVKIRNFGLEGDFSIVTANLHICRGDLYIRLWHGCLAQWGFQTSMHVMYGTGVRKP